MFWKRLRKYGARKVSLVGLGLIGCTPDAIKTYGTNGSSCVEKLNNASQQFNQKLVALVDELNTNFTDSKFIYVNSYEMGSGDPTLVGTYNSILNLSHFSVFSCYIKYGIEANGV